jgi:hypothetical protein
MATTTALTMMATTVLTMTATTVTAIVVRAAGASVGHLVQCVLYLSSVEAVLCTLSLHLPFVHTAFLLCMLPSSCHHRETTTYRELPSTAMTATTVTAMTANYSQCTTASCYTMNTIFERTAKSGIFSLHSRNPSNPILTYTMDCKPNPVTACGLLTQSGRCLRIG